MNRPLVLLLVLVLVLGPPWVRGRGRGRERLGSWSRRAIVRSSELSMNCPLTPSLSPSDGERVAGGRVRGGSWSQCMRKNERGLSMNRLLVAASRQSAAGWLLHRTAALCRDAATPVHGPNPRPIFGGVPSP